MRRLLPGRLLDRILRGLELNSGVDDIARRTGIDAADVARIERLVRRSEHKRHAPLVASVCRLTVADPTSAEDAFQATFLILLAVAQAFRVGIALRADSEEIV